MAVLLKPGELEVPEKDLFLPGNHLPKNFKPGPGVKVEVVTSDMYNICNRLAAVNERLVIHEITDAGGAYHYYAICERTPVEGGYKDELVFRTDELDGRTVEYCQYLMKIPLGERFAACEKLQAKNEEAHRQFELDKLYEDLGAPMLRQLYHDGFVDGAKPNANIPYKRRKKLK